MFKRVLESLSKSLGSKPAPPKPAPSAPASVASSAKPGSLLDKVGGLKTPPTPAPAPPSINASPEELCGITPKMTKQQISDQLKLLYRRYNRGASSLNAKVRAEADRMLDAIVAVREKHFGEL